MYELIYKHPYIHTHIYKYIYEIGLYKYLQKLEKKFRKIVNGDGNDIYTC